MIKAASSIMDGISKWMSDNPTATAALLTGGAGALGGFAMTQTDPDEDAETAMKRRLKNALIVGGLGAGVGALGSEAIKAFDTALPNPEPTIVDKAAPWIEAAGGAAAGAYGGGVIGQKLVNSDLPGIGQKSVTLDLAKALEPKRKIESVGEARAAIARIVQGDNALSNLATALNKTEVDATTVEEIANKLGKLNIKPKGVTNVELANALKKVKPKGRWGVIGALGLLGLGGGAFGGWKLGDLIHSND